MNRPEFDAHLVKLGLSQTDAARLLSVDPRTVRRWAELPSEIPGPVVQVLRAWASLNEAGLAWRPDSLSLGEPDPEKLEKFMKAYRDHAIDLHGTMKRVLKRGGPTQLWKVDLDKKCATFGPMKISFYLLANGSFSPCVYTRTDESPVLERDWIFLEDAFACIAHALTRSARSRRSASRLATIRKGGR